MSKPFKREPGSRTIPKWIIGSGGEAFSDIVYEVAEGIAKITINRPEVRNAFRPQTLFELQEAFSLARDDDSVGVIIFTGAGTDAFCSGGDINVRGDDGYLGNDPLAKKGIGRLNVLDLQIQIRRLPKPVVAMVAGWAVGGGHVLHVVCDLTIAADNAKFGQTGPMVGSFDGGYGAGLLAAHIGQKKAREIWFLCRQCLVDIEINGRAFPKPQASCTIPVEPNMIVKTQLTSPVADKAQKGVMELLLGNHPLDCPVCDKGGECPLQNQAMSNGRPDARLDGYKRTFEKPINISSSVLLDRERCVLCARCTRSFA